MKKTALITGATRGIGRAIALRLSGLGYDVCLVGRDEAQLEETASGCRERGRRATVMAGDLCDADFVQQVARDAEAALAGIGALVNNAGAAHRQAIQDADLDAWQKIWTLNFESVLRLTHAVLPGMIARASGAVVNISSISGRNTPPGSGIYSATKHAINGLTGCTFEDVREHGIKVTSIMPGFVDTALTSMLGKDGGKMLQPDDVADAVAYVLMSSPTCCPTEIVLRPQRAP